MKNDDVKVGSTMPDVGMVKARLEHDLCGSETDCAPISPQRRKAIKLALSAAATIPVVSQAFAQQGIGIPSKNLPANLTSVIDAVDDKPTDFEPPNLTININVNRQDLDDWLLLENLTESPLLIRRFSPRFVAYNASVLDMNAMLNRQQRGIDQLEIWPNHAWTHSVKGATSKRDIDQIFEYSNTIMIPNMPDNRSLQLSCIVDQSGVVRISDLPV